MRQVPWGLMSLACVVCLAGSAAAQPVARFADLPLRLNTGDTVIIVDAGGATTRGTLTDMRADALSLRTADRPERTFAAADVRRLDRRGDSLSNGMKWGAVVGVALGCVAGASFAERWRWNDCAPGMVLIGPFYFGVAVLIDAVHVGQTTVYAAPAASSVDGTRRAAARVVLTW